MGVGIEIINFVKSRSSYSQVVIGTATGYLTSFLFMRFCKLAAALAGGAILLMKIAELEELVYIDWGRGMQEINSVKAPPRKTFINNKQLEQIAKSPKNFQIGYAGGFLLGVGCS